MVHASAVRTVPALLPPRSPFLPCVSDVRGLSPSLSAPGQATEEPAEERKQRRGEELEGGMDGRGEGVGLPSGPPEAALVSITRREERVILTDNIPQRSASSSLVLPFTPTDPAWVNFPPFPVLSIHSVHFSLFHCCSDALNAALPPATPQTNLSSFL